jgi:hypothetical protein
MRGAGPWHVITFPWGAGRGAPASLRFCAQATDGSANVGKRTCAVRFLPKKTKKKRR